MKSITVPVKIGGSRSKKDRTMSLTMTLPVINAEEKALFFEMDGIDAEMTLSPMGEDAPVYKINKEFEYKSPSTRLRNILFVLWGQSGKTGDFDSFYKLGMETIIEHYKEKLT